MVDANPKPGNVVVRALRRVYNPLGFQKGYNAILSFLSLGYLLGFVLARLQYLSFYGVFCSGKSSAAAGASPGECYYWLKNPYKIGMMLHLFTILPAAFLVVWQFIPVIRHRVILFHRINGYLIVLLGLCANAGALIIARHSFGGDFSTQTWVGTLVILTTIGFIMAITNIKLLQIDQHRAWMMRTWAWFSTIITLRLIMFLAAMIISNTHTWYTVRPCAQIASLLGHHGTLAFYPGCAPFFNGTSPNAVVIITADMAGKDPMQTSAALSIPFGTAGWLSLVLHTIAIELYLRLTPAESSRLRQVSYERQLARGFKRPGYAGLVAERFGDAETFLPARAVVTDAEFLEPKDLGSSSDDNA